MPLYWADETSGVLRAAVTAYLADDPMTEQQIAHLREYLQHWIDYPGWRGEKVRQLRLDAAALRTRTDISMWLSRATYLGIDPL